MKRIYTAAQKKYAPIFRGNGELFWGIALFLLGMLHFSHGKYCDGNPADYYSCTNPAVYYYYDSGAVLLAILGAFSIAAWFLQKRHQL